MSESAESTDRAEVAVPSQDMTSSGEGGAVAPPAGSLARNISAMLVAQIITSILAAVIAVVVPRFLGPEAIGHFQLATSIWAVGLAAVSLGTNTVVGLQVARNSRARSVDLGPPLVARLVAFAFAWIPLGGFVLIAGYDRDVIVLFVLVGVAAVGMCLAELYRSALGGFERFTAAARIEIVVKVATAVLVVTAAVTTRKVLVVGVVAIVPAFLSAALLGRAVRRVVVVTYDRSRRKAWSAVKAGAPYMSLSIALVLYMQADVVLMSFFVSDVEIGWYGQADALFSTLLFVPTIMMTSLFPRQVRQFADDPDAAHHMLAQGFRTLMMVAIPIGLGVVLTSNAVVHLFYGERFAGTAPVLAVYGVVLIIMFETILLGQHSISAGRPNFWLALMILGVVLTVPLDIVFIPWTEDHFDNGAIGGALSYVVTELMMLVAALWKLAPQLVSKASAVRLIKCLVAGGALLAAGWPLRDRSLPLTILVGAIVYVGVLVMTRPFDAFERDLIRRATGKFPALRNS